MGVYLPNVDMPKDDKAVTIQICPDGSIWQQYRGTVPNAKAIHVPKHGPLVDVWNILNAFPDKYIFTNAQVKAFMNYIIPAEEGE